MTDDTETEYEISSLPLNVRVPFDIRNSLDMRAKQLGWTRSQLVKQYLVNAIINDEFDQKSLIKKEDAETEYQNFVGTLACGEVSELENNSWYAWGRDFDYVINVVKKGETL